jgi:hypothetical protein
MAPTVTARESRWQFKSMLAQAGAWLLQFDWCIIIMIMKQCE